MITCLPSQTTRAQRRAQGAVPGNPDPRSMDTDRKCSVTLYWLVLYTTPFLLM